MGPVLRPGQHVSGGQQRTKAHTAERCLRAMLEHFYNTYLVVRLGRVSDPVATPSRASTPAIQRGLLCLLPQPQLTVKSPAATASRRDGRVPSEVAPDDGVDATRRDFRCHARCCPLRFAAARRASALSEAAAT